MYYNKKFQINIDEDNMKIYLKSNSTYLKEIIEDKLELE